MLYPVRVNDENPVSFHVHIGAMILEGEVDGLPRHAMLCYAKLAGIVRQKS